MSKSEPNPRPRRPTDNRYLKYSGMVFQMAAAILLGLFLGRWLDGQFGTEPILLVVGTLFGVFSGLYLSLKDFL